MILYIITNIINNKVYIGYTTNVDIEWYWNKHFSNAKQYSTRYFYRAIKKYGRKAFKCEILERFDTYEDVRQAEINAIAKYKSNIIRYGNEYGYNMTDGGDGHLGPISEETKAKISKSHFGVRPSEETRKKMSDIKKGKASNYKGKKTSEETRKKQSLAKKGKESLRKGKSKYSIFIDPVIQDRKNGLSYRKLAKKYNIPLNAVRWIFKCHW